jgi:hypothetical protein
VIKVQHLLREKEKELLRANTELQEWKQSCHRWPATNDSSDEEEEAWFDWKKNLGYTSN